MQWPRIEWSYVSTTDILNQQYFVLYAELFLIVTMMIITMIMITTIMIYSFGVIVLLHQHYNENLLRHGVMLKQQQVQVVTVLLHLRDHKKATEIWNYASMSMAKLCQARIQSTKQSATWPGLLGLLRILMGAPHKSDAYGMRRTLFITAGIHPALECPFDGHLLVNIAFWISLFGWAFCD